MISRTPNYDVKVKAILDSTQPGERVCALTGEEWMMTEEEIGWYKKFNVPPSGVSPVVRRKQLFGFNVGTSVWWNKHCETGEPIVSYIHLDNPMKVLPDLEWHARDFSTLETPELDLSRPFIPQLVDLIRTVPVTAARNFGEVKNTIGFSMVSAEDSFMVFGGVINAKRAAYGFMVKDMEDCQDTYISDSCQDTFGVNHSSRMFRCRVALQCQDCIESSFLFDCRNCESCFMSSNLRNSQYVFRNERLSKEAYEEKMKTVNLSSYRAFQSHWNEYLQLLGEEAVWPENFNVQCDECTGEYLVRCTRCCNGFSLKGATDTYFSQLTNKDSQGCAYSSGFQGSQDCYMVTGSTYTSGSKFGTMVTHCMGTEYCFNCFDCEYCFGCVGLRNKKFHIFNRPYKETEYWQMLDAIKCAMLERGEYGEYLPGSVSPSGMKAATELHFDMTDEEIERLGGVLYDVSHGSMVSDDRASSIEAIKIDALPDTLPDCEPFVGKAIEDEELGRLYSVRKSDFAFYQKHGLPFPRHHFITRVKKIARLSNTFTYSKTVCRSCQKEIEVADNPTFENRKVYCMACYLKYLETR